MSSVLPKSKMAKRKGVVDMFTRERLCSPQRAISKSKLLSVTTNQKAGDFVFAREREDVSRNATNKENSRPIDDFTPLRPNRIISSRGEGFRAISKRSGHDRKYIPLPKRGMRSGNVNPLQYTNLNPIKIPVIAMEKCSLGPQFRSGNFISKNTLPSTSKSAWSRDNSRRTRSESGGRGLKDRKKPKRRNDFLAKQEAKHEKVKRDEIKLWKRIDHPTADQPLNPEKGFSEDAIGMAKRGRQCAMESAACGSTHTRKEIWKHERSAWEHGDVTMEAERLLEYPQATLRYNTALNELHLIAGWKRGNGDWRKCQ